MRIAYFATALIASMLVSVQAVDLEGYSHADADVDACEEVVNGMKIRLNTPECKEEKKVPFEAAVTGALGELSSKSNDLASALKVQFEKNRQLKAGQIMNVSGQLIVRPKSEDLEVTVPKKEEDEKKDKPVTVKVEGKEVQQKAQVDTDSEMPAAPPKAPVVRKPGMTKAEKKAALTGAAQVDSDSEQPMRRSPPPRAPPKARKA